MVSGSRFPLEELIPWSRGIHPELLDEIWCRIRTPRRAAHKIRKANRFLLGVARSFPFSNCPG